MGFANIDEEELGVLLECLVHLFNSTRLLNERRSGPGPEDEHDGLLADHLRESVGGLSVRALEGEVRSLLADAWRLVEFVEAALEHDLFVATLDEDLVLWRVPLPPVTSLLCAT